ncbi:helix-turn-helix transcriptional regulator [Candidatus Soleaferrea massiliensis]|uniref:helix-turn-helix transcriptional regulator n=1 Tax=Candidatus Soleaferrea massiliensis TaxID=1470354 RepID=UPI0012E038CE|nr:helix-turn-helix transcriptional regulator [Candidatus Soleaferrea massiliensis]
MRNSEPLSMRLRAMREDHDLTQKQVADVLSIQQQYYSSYEKGIYELPVRHLRTLARLYHCSVDYILGLTEFRHPINKLQEPFENAITVGILLSHSLSLNSQKRKLLLEYLDYLRAIQNKQ